MLIKNYKMVFIYKSIIFLFFYFIYKNDNKW